MKNAHPSHENINYDNAEDSSNGFIEAMADMREF